HACQARRLSDATAIPDSVRLRPNHPVRGIQAITALPRWQSRTSIRPRTYSGRLDPFVIAGLDPAIHPLRKKFLRRMMDPRVKPAGDGAPHRGVRSAQRAQVPPQAVVAATRDPTGGA